MKIRLFLIFFMLFCATTWVRAQNGYEILLNNGGRITTRSYYEEENLLCYEKYGSLVKISKSSVQKINALGDEPDVETIIPDSTLFGNNDDQNSSAGKGTPRAAAKKKEKSELEVCQTKLNMYKNSARLHCGQAAYDEQQITPAPNIPGNYARISNETAESFKKHVSGKVKAIRSNRNCDYYRDMVEHYQKKCEEIETYGSSL